MSDFPTKANPQLCKNGCGAKIYLSKDTGKYLPYNLDDSQHDCRDQTKTSQPAQETTSQNNQNNNNKEQVEKFDYNDVAVLDKILKIAKHAVEHDNKEFKK